MTRVKTGASAVFLGLVLAAGGAAAPTTDFKALMQKEMDAWCTLDARNAAPLYAKEADRVFFDLSPLKYTGWDDYAAGFQKVVADFKSMRIQVGDDFKANEHGGSLAWGTATFHVDVELNDGTKLPLDGRWTVIWQKFGKDWLVVHEHVSAPLPPPASAGQSLYKRLGGYDALAAVTDDFVQRLATDPQLAKFFAGHSTDSLKRLRQLVVDQLCEATGGPCYYTGRSTKTAHAGLGITEDQWNATANHLVETLDKFNVPPKEKNEVLSAISGLKSDIVAPK